MCKGKALIEIQQIKYDDKINECVKCDMLVWYVIEYLWLSKWQTFVSKLRAFNYYIISVGTLIITSISESDII
jgi:hypothetical protein